MLICVAPMPICASPRYAEVVVDGRQMSSALLESFSVILCVPDRNKGPDKTPNLRAREHSNAPGRCRQPNSDVEVRHKGEDDIETDGIDIRQWHTRQSLPYCDGM